MKGNEVVEAREEGAQLVLLGQLLCAIGPVAFDVGALWSLATLIAELLG